jgi:hypothetical protein
MPAAALPCVVLTAARGESDPGPVCSSCGSANIVPIEWDGPTGVVAPDGGCEYRRQAGYRCRDCGAEEEL